MLGIRRRTAIRTLIRFMKGTVLGDKEQGSKEKEEDLRRLRHWRPCLVMIFFKILSPLKKAVCLKDV